MTVTSRVAVSSGEVVGLMLAAGLAILGAVALLGSRDPRLMLVAPVVGVGLVFAARRPLLAVTIMVVVEVTNMSGVLAPYGGIPFFQASMLLGVLAVGFALRDPQARSRLNAWTVIFAGLLAVYLATQAVAAIGSVDVATSIAGMRRPILDCVFLMVVLLLVQMTARPWAVAAAIVVPFAVLSVLTVIDQVFYGGTASFGGFSTVTQASGEFVTTLRFGGPLPDSNFWGRHLVMGLPLAAALLTRALRSRRRPAVMVWAVAVTALLAGIYLTQSRGTFLAAGTAIAVWFIASDRSIRRRGLAMLPVGLLAFAVPGVGNRLLVALQDVAQADVNYNVDLSLLQRLGAQQQAWMMFDERPYFGFGPATFTGEVINFAGRVPTAVREPTIAPHNLYAELAAESGVFGLLGWATLILGFLAVVVLRIVQEPASRDRVLAAAVCAGLVAWSVASIALHLAYFRTLAVVLALAAGLAPAWPVPAETIRRFVRGVGVWLAAGLAGLSVFWMCLSATGSPALTASQRMTLVPVGPLDGYYAYALDVRSRMELLPTIAIMVHDPDLPVAITADPVRGVLTFSATETRADAARDDIQRAIAHADTMLRSAIGYQQYSLQALDSMRVVPSVERPPLAPFLAAGAGAGTALAAGVLLSRAVRRRPVGALASSSPREVSSV